MFDERHVIYRYKYMPFSEGALKALTDSTMKFTCPLEFNDPFDCLPHYDSSSIHEISRTRPELFREAARRKGLSPAKRLQMQGPMVAQLRNRINDGTFAKELISGVGVVSLSKDALNIPMWSHYADFHRGLVLEFRIPVKGKEQDIQFITERLLPFPIEYSRERPHIKLGVEHTDDLLKKVILTKSIDWKYEEEERVIDNKRGAGIHPYRRDDILCSVIAGLKMEERNYLRLESIVQELSEIHIPNLSLYRANIKDGQYKLEVAGHPRLSIGNT